MIAPQNNIIRQAELPIMSLIPVFGTLRNEKRSGMVFMPAFVAGFILFFLLMTFQVRAQETLTLSLDQTIGFAIDHNKALKNAKYAVDKSTQALREVIAQGLPQIDASVDYNNYLGGKASIQFSPSAPATTIEFNPTSSFSGTVSQLVFSGNYYVGIQLSKLAKAITMQNYQRNELDVKEQAINTYCMILANERILNILKENKRNAQLIYEKTVNMSRAGLVEQTDAKKLSVMVALVDNEVKSSERQVELGYNLLRLHLGLPSKQDIRLVSTLEDIAAQYVLNSTLEDPFIIDNNIDYQMVLKQGEIAKKSINMKKANYLPTLVAYYSRNEKLLKPLFDVTPKNVVGLTLNVPIFSSGQRYAQVNQAKIDYKISENNKELLVDQLSLEERQIRYNYKTLKDQFQVQKTNVEVAKEVLDKMNLKYEQGVVSSIELTTANNDYLTAETTFTSVILQLLTAETTLRKINNKL